MDKMQPYCQGQEKRRLRMDKIHEHKQICDNLNVIYINKNNDYGDSFAKVKRELGDIAILVRLMDKLERLKTLIKGAAQQVNDESINNTLTDLANYCIMELVERKLGERKQKEDLYEVRL